MNLRQICTITYMYTVPYESSKLTTSKVLDTISIDGGNAMLGVRSEFRIEPNLPISTTKVNK